MAGPLDHDPLIPPPDAPAVHNHGPALVWTMPWRFTPGRDVLVVIAKLTVRLVPGGPCEPLDEPDPPSGDVHHDDDEAASLAYSSDFAPHKPRADVLLTGHAWARGERAAVRVQLKLGDVDRVLTATGDRTWTPAGLRGPAPFEKIPLRWELAWGGEGVSTNPVGIGGETASDNPLGRVANLEDPRFPVTAAIDQARPACTAPVAPAWEPRASKVGDYKGDWHRTRWPLLPESFDYAHYNAAPPEQQTKHLRGDEAYTLGGVHPELAALSGTLPAKRPRVYAERRASAGGGFYEVRLALDTVHFMPDEAKAVLVWRGAVDAADAWGTDLLALHVLSVDHDEALTPDEARARAEALRAHTEAPDDETAPEDPADDPRIALAAAGAVGVPVLRAPEEPPEPAPLARDEIVARLARGESLAGADLTGSDLSSLDLRGHDLTGALAERATFAGCALDGAVLTECALSGADFSNASMKSAVLERADLTNARLAAADLTGAVLTDATLARAFAHEAVFREVDGAGADFTSASLDGCVFVDAKLAGADFTLAHVERADFSRALLDDARMNESWAAGVVLDGASLTDFRAEGADLRDARITQAKADGALFQASRLDGARFDGSSLAEALFSRAVLDGASFGRVEAVEADFRRALLRGTSLLRANLMKARFGGADLERADFRGANLFEAELRDAKTDRADFTAAHTAGSGLD